MTQLTRRRLIAAGTAGAASLLLARFSHAQENYPNKPINVILPLQAGSASDIAVRVFCEKLAEEIKGTFVIENVPGAAGLIGAERLTKATRDGHTLGALNNSILTILPNVKRGQVKFDPLADFVPLRGIASIPTLLAVNKDVPINNVRELVAFARQNPGKLNYSSGGPGSPQHLATEMFQAMSGVKLTHVPYKGATQAAADLAGGQVQVMFIAHSLALPFLPGGRVKPIAFAGGERSIAFPDLPTVAEAGLSGFDYSSWVALFAPRDTPAAVVKLLRDASARVLAQASIKERLAKSGLELWDLPAERVSAVIRDDYARWEKVVKTPGFSAE